jgi:transcriptional activator for dhaKLM operon
MYSAWLDFVNTHTLRADVDPLVAHSWQRCSPRLSPFHKPIKKKLSPKNLLAVQSTNFGLISLARPIMEDIHQFIENTNTVIILVNSAGYVLDLLGDKSMKAVAQDFNITNGVAVAEGLIGTNAFALALTERVPARVTGPQHFLEHFHDLADAAAPIFDPYGRPLGALGVLTLAKTYHSYAMGLIVAGARAIEGQLQSELILQEQNSHLAELNAILAAISEAILVWDAEGLLMHANTAATEIINKPTSALVGHRVDDALPLPTFILEAVRSQKPLTNVEATFNFQDRSVNCVLTLSFVKITQDDQWVILALQHAEQVRKLIQDQVGPKVTLSIDDFVGESSQIRRLRHLAKTAAPAQACVLIRGEVGTGKDYLARALHNASTRREQPFIIFGCSSVPNELVVDEILGYEDGASPAHRGGRPSKFELAHGGTLFFQDIDALPLEAQAILLNALEMGIVHRLGSTRAIEVDVRVIAAAATKLEHRVAQGGFRADLFYRLSPFEITIPPLRERAEDIPLFVERILARLSRHHQRTLQITPEAMDIIKRYPWPGNTRELEAVLERTVIQSGASELIGPMHLPDYVRQPTVVTPKGERAPAVPTLEAMEREAIIQAARVCKGNVTKMARVLGIGRTTVWRKLKDLNISADYFRQGTPPS